jgi:hypothetical protein
MIGWILAAGYFAARTSRYSAIVPARSHVDWRVFHARKYAANRYQQTSGFPSVTVADGVRRADWCAWHRLMDGSLFALPHGRSPRISRATTNLALFAWPRCSLCPSWCCTPGIWMYFHSQPFDTINSISSSTYDRVYCLHIIRQNNTKDNPVNDEFCPPVGLHPDLVQLDAVAHPIWRLAPGRSLLDPRSWPMRLLKKCTRRLDPMGLLHCHPNNWVRKEH